MVFNLKYPNRLFFLGLQIALANIGKFRRKNWQFDVIGGFVYFVLVFSMFPQVRDMNNLLCMTYLLLGTKEHPLMRSLSLNLENIIRFSNLIKP